MLSVIMIGGAVPAAGLVNWLSVTAAAEDYPSTVNAEPVKDEAEEMPAENYKEYIDEEKFAELVGKAKEAVEKIKEEKAA